MVKIDWNEKNPMIFLGTFLAFLIVLAIGMVINALSVKLVFLVFGW